METNGVNIDKEIVVWNEICILINNFSALKLFKTNLYTGFSLIDRYESFFFVEFWITAFAEMTRIEVLISG